MVDNGLSMGWLSFNPKTTSNGILERSEFGSVKKRRILTGEGCLLATGFDVSVAVIMTESEYGISCGDFAGESGNMPTDLNIEQPDSTSNMIPIATEVVTLIGSASRASILHTS